MSPNADDNPKSGIIGLNQYWPKRKGTVNSDLSEYEHEAIMVEINTIEKRAEKNFPSVALHFELESNDRSQKDLVSFRNINRALIRDSLINVKKLEAEIEVEKELYYQETCETPSDEKFQEKFSNLYKQLKEAKSSYNFKKRKLDELRSPENREKCPICHDFIPDGQLSIYSCCHVFCYSCFKNCKLTNCPVCFQYGALRQVLNDPTADELQAKHQIIIDDSNSRLRKVACYIKDLVITKPA